MELGGAGGMSMAHPSRTESPEAFKTPNKYKKSIHNQNKQHSVLPGTSDLGRDAGIIEVDRNNHRNGESVKYK